MHQLALGAARNAPLLPAEAKKHQRLVADVKQLESRMALEGKLILVPEPLFLRREHPNSSVKKFPKLRDRDNWFNPRRVSRVQMPYWRWSWEYLRSVRMSTLGSAERLRCSREVVRWAVRARRAFLRDLGRIPASLRG